MPDGAPDDPTKHVAPSLVARSNPVGEQEGHGARVIGDHLIAEASRFELVRTVTCDRSERSMDGHEEIGVVVREHLLAHAGESLQPHAGVHALEGEFGSTTVGVLFVLHEDEIPDLQPARAPLRVVRYALGAA